MVKEPTHLGDGAYASFDQWRGIVVTANHHSPTHATDAVYLNERAMLALCRWYFGEEVWTKMLAAGGPAT
jgi:hypothetical protein